MSYAFFSGQIKRKHILSVVNFFQDTGKLLLTEIAQNPKVLIMIATMLLSQIGICEAFDGDRDSDDDRGREIEGAEAEFGGLGTYEDTTSDNGRFREF